MSVASIIDPSVGTIRPQYLPLTSGSVATPILFTTPGALPATLTGIFNCPLSGNYYIQLYIRLGSAGDVGITPTTYSYTSSDGWGNNSISPASLALELAGPPAIQFPFVFTTIGFISAGQQTFTFTPGSGLQLGLNGEIALRVVGPVVG